MIKKRAEKRGKDKRTAQNMYSEPLTRQKRKYFSFDEIQRFFGVLKGNRDKAMFRVMYLKALRASEVGMLRMEDYHEREGRLFVRRLKNSRAGEFRLHRQEGQFLRAWVRERGHGPGAIFRSRNHRPISRRQLDRLVKHYGALAGIPREKCHAHALKHSRGTHLLSEERDITVVQDQLGHRNIQNTMIYAEVQNAAREELFEKHKDRW
jgi:site-specific recombinase XerD